MKKGLIEVVKVLRQFSFTEWIQAIGGFLLLMYVPLLIGLIWFDTQIMIKMLATNTVLVLGVWLADRPNN